MKRYIFASVSATDQISIPADKILGLDTTDAESLVIHFAGLGTDDNQGAIDLEIKAGSVKTACRAIVEAINYSTNPFVVVADDVNSVYLHADIEDVTTITL
jgi:hypothetical protein